jgi:hypothetical protein
MATYPPLVLAEIPMTISLLKITALKSMKALSEIAFIFMLYLFLGTIVFPEKIK